MSRRAPKPARYTISYLPGVPTDLATLERVDSALLAAVLATVDDLAHGRQRGKALGERHVTGDLSGLMRLRFDLPGVRPARFRIVYRLVDHETGPRS